MKDSHQKSNSFEYLYCTGTMPQNLSTSTTTTRRICSGHGGRGSGGDGGGGGCFSQVPALCVKNIKIQKSHKNHFIKVHLFNKLLLLVLPDDSDVHAYL